MLPCLQDKALSEMDKEESPAESNESDSEEAAVDQDKALTEKTKVNTIGQVMQEKKNKKRKEEFTFC